MSQKALVTANWATLVLGVFTTDLCQYLEKASRFLQEMVLMSLVPPPDIYDVEEGLHALWQSAGEKTVKVENDHILF